MIISIENFGEICRLCATKNEQMIHIYTKEGIQYNLETKIHSFLPFITLTKNDMLPDSICFECASTLIVFGELWKTSSNTNILFKYLVTNKTNKTKDSKENEKLQRNELISYSNKMNDSSIINSSNQTIQQRLIPKVTKKDILFKKWSSNTKRYTETQKNILIGQDEIVNFPPSKYHSLQTLTQNTLHIEKYWSIPLMERKQNFGANSIPVITISDDEGKENAYLRSRPMATSSPIPCDLVPSDEIENQPIQPSIIDHTYSCRSVKAVNTPPLLICEKCGHLYRSKRRLSQHAAKCDIEQPPRKKTRKKCNIYDKFKVEYNGVVYYKCDHCSYISQSKNNPSCFANHYRLHTTGFDVKCEQCPRQFRTRAIMLHHVDVVHLGRKDFQCAECEKRFADRTTLKGHLLIHTGEKRLVCEECGKRFGRSSQLKVHVKFVHKKERNIKCTECHKTFCTGNQLRNHMRRHSGVREFCCPVCNKAFITKKTMIEHSLTVHSDEKNYTCNVCNKSYKKKSALVIHKQKAHGKN